MFRLRSLSMAPVLALCAALAAAVLPRPAAAQDIRYFRIGTGSISGVYFPVGGLIANIISNPPGSRACDEGGSCGVPGLIAVVQATLGSVANVHAVQSGMLESAMVQADIASFAYHGTGPFAREKPFKELRAIANLYPEAVHVVVRRDSPIKSMSDLAGRRVSLDLTGSGTRAVALTVLEVLWRQARPSQADQFPDRPGGGSHPQRQYRRAVLRWRLSGVGDHASCPGDPDPPSVGGRQGGRGDPRP